jgi:hypothetical protein
MTAYLLNPTIGDYIVPESDAGPIDLAVAPNFERFDGLAGGGAEGIYDRNAAPGGTPMEHPATYGVEGGGTGLGFVYNPTPRPGGTDQPLGQVYTPGPLAGVVGAVGGQPLALSTGTRILRAPGDYTPSKMPTVQFRLGVSQHGPSALGVEHTVVMSEITGNPPVPGDISSIIAGWG